MTGALSVLPEQSLRDAVDLLVRLVAATGALVIFLGAALAAGSRSWRVPTSSTTTADTIGHKTLTLSSLHPRTGPATHVTAGGPAPSLRGAHSR